MAGFQFLMDNDVINRNKEHEKGADLRLVALNNF
jgi:hypothetical protein